MACKQHKKYQAKRKPRVLCLACWEMFLGNVRDVEDFTLEDTESTFIVEKVLPAMFPEWSKQNAE